MKANNLSREMEWFLRSLKRNFSVEAQSEDVVVEAVELGKEEVDCFYLPSEAFDELPETLQYEIMIVDDEDRN